MTKEMTKGSPAKLIIAFTIPLLIGNIFQQFYSMADTLIVGRTIGVNALAAVGSTGSISFLILGFVFGVTTGLSIIVAQRFGAGDMAGLRRSVATGIWISLIMTAILTAVSVIFARQILELMNTPPEIIEDAYDYIIIIFWGTIANMIFNLFSNIIRALGDSKMPLVFLIVACVLNIILDFVFILGLNSGVAGAAWATVISQMVSGLLCIFYIVKKIPMIHLSKEDLKSNSWDFKQHLEVALPMGFQMSIIAIGAVVLQFVLNGLGAISVAAFTAAQKIDQIATQPMNSFGTTMATYSAQNYGAGKIDRIKKGVFQCSLISVGFSVFMGFVNIFAGYMLTAVFVGKENVEVLHLSQVYLKVNGSLYFVLALLFIFRFTLQGLGRSVMPTLAGIMELVMRIFAAVILTSRLGFLGASWAGPLAWIGACIPLIIGYFVTIRGLQKKKDEKERLLISE
ncbi:putative MATE family efflux protein [Aequitasia blattaphilus]|uniref:MATE family efflux transporter n=1 Tax=Aequitasia blattaphilus TaxID=2949332 RepID=A0ABT1E8Z8_9FIRM|nr:MATE family efflux transporter [Aequitasia blattaphilus]MCP1102243.1 MATE family efflux transporter [Aequitasia blattaphilus]MCR8614883.1 MATE family efflux transporter [Aequitasia blattaphilus]